MEESVGQMWARAAEAEHFKLFTTGGRATYYVFTMAADSTAKLNAGTGPASSTKRSNSASDACTEA